MLAEDTGGDSGDGGGEAPPADGDSSGDHETPPELIPCPFFGHTDLDDSGDQVKCNVCSCMGPVAGSGMDKYGAWNSRPTEDADPSAADDPMPDAAPAASAKKLGTLEKAKTAFVAQAETGRKLVTICGTLRNNLAASRVEAKTAKETVTALSAASATALAAQVKAEAALAVESKAHADYKAAEGSRVNSAALRIAASQGIPTPVKINTNTEGNADPSKAKTAPAAGLDKVTAAFKAQLDAIPASN